MRKIDGRGETVSPNHANIIASQPMYTDGAFISATLSSGIACKRQEITSAPQLLSIARCSGWHALLPPELLVFVFAGSRIDSGHAFKMAAVTAAVHKWPASIANAR